MIMEFFNKYFLNYKKIFYHLEIIKTFNISVSLKIKL